MRLLLIVAALGSVFAEEVEAPDISDFLRAKYWQDLNGVNAAKVALNDAQLKLSQTLGEMSAVCKGEVYATKGQPTCKKP